MSTISLEYPTSLSLRRDFNLRWIVALVAGLVLVASVILVAASSVKADSSLSVVAIPARMAQVVDTQTQPTVMATPAPKSVVIAVPVPEPPAP